MNNIWQQLPDDIVDKIITLKNSNDHYEVHKKNLNEIPLQAVKMKIYFINKSYIQRNDYETFEEILLDNTTLDERCNMMIQLNKCNCCSEHKKRKPSFKDYCEGFVPDYSTNPYREKPCECFCRHFCRAICRADNDEVFI
tara:strand:+ start:92 stop:511 length:420 start_codon:yes stop_codon:yes gene_type:complete